MMSCASVAEDLIPLKLFLSSLLVCFWSQSRSQKSQKNFLCSTLCGLSRSNHFLVTFTLITWIRHLLMCLYFLCAVSVSFLAKVESQRSQGKKKFELHLNALASVDVRFKMMFHAWSTDARKWSEDSLAMLSWWQNIPCSCRTSSLHNHIHWVPSQWTAPYAVLLDVLTKKPAQVATSFPFTPASLRARALTFCYSLICLIVLKWAFQ